MSPRVWNMYMYEGLLKVKLNGTEFHLVGLNCMISKLSDAITSLREENRHEIKNVNFEVNKLRLWEK